MKRSENQITVTLIKYYQQKKALQNLLEEYKNLNNLKGYNNTLMFYNENITTLRKQLNEINPTKLQEIDAQRTNNRTVKGSENITNRSVKSV
jgi:hypothetical protein